MILRMDQEENVEFKSVMRGEGREGKKAEGRKTQRADLDKGKQEELIIRCKRKKKLLKLRMENLVPTHCNIKYLNAWYRC